MMDSFNESLFVYFDGSFKNNIGSIGFVIKNQGGDVLLKSKEYLQFIDSNTEAELFSLYTSIKTVCNEFNIEDRVVYVFSDNQNIIDVIDDDTCCTFNEDEFQKYITESVEMLREAEFMVFKKISSYDNKEAHFLSNSAIENPC